MKKKVIIVVIYLIGCFCAYQLGKYDIETRFHHWRVVDRRVVLLFSACSWASVVVFGFSILQYKYSHFDGYDEKANW